LIERRALLRAAGLALLAAPLETRAQPGRATHRIGFLGGASASGYAPLVEALRQGLRDHGYARRLAELVIRSRLPSIGFREYCEAGGLLAYGVDFPHIWRQSATLVDRVLKGAKPADLPIQQATRFELVINSRTAKALGVTIPPDMMTRADEVIR
jgi:hypothetical protein